MRARASVAGKLTSKIRAPLREGEERRYAPVAQDDPDRVKLVGVCALRDEAAAKRAAAEAETDPAAAAPKWDEAISALESWREACETFVADNIGLAVDYVKKNNSSHVPRDDLHHAAIAGLLEALKRFDVTKAGRFSTYAVWRMRYEVDQLSHDKQGPLVKIPGDLRDDQWSVDSAVKRLSAELGRVPEDGEVLDALRAEEAADQDRGRKKKASSRWARASAEAVRVVRETYSGVAYSPLDPRELGKLFASEGAAELAEDDRIALRDAVAGLSPVLRAVVAEEFDFGDGADPSLVPECPVARDVALRLALRKLHRELG